TRRPRGPSGSSSRPRSRDRLSVLDERLELLAAGGVAELAQGLGLDLADALASDLEVLADLLERVIALLADPEPHAKHLLLARRERLQDLARLVAQVQPDDRILRRHHGLVLD